MFRGHADGIIVAGPQLPALRYPCLWEHKCLKARGFKAIERDGLAGLYASYAAQVAIYQAYLDVTNPALFSVVNADTCERLHFLVPFDAELAQAISDRAVMVIEATRAGELLPRITDDPNDWRCKMCSHRERCWAMSALNEPIAKRIASCFACWLGFRRRSAQCGRGDEKAVQGRGADVPRHRRP